MNVSLLHAENLLHNSITNTNYTTHNLNKLAVTIIHSFLPAIMKQNTEHGVLTAQNMVMKKPIQGVNCQLSIVEVQ